MYKRMRVCRQSKKIVENTQAAGLSPVAELMNFCQKSTSSAADDAEKRMELLNDGPSDLRIFRVSYETK